MHNPGTSHSITLSPVLVSGAYLLLSIGGLASAAQEPLALRQAVNQALGQSPQAEMARADRQGAKSSAAMARSQLLPQLNFTEEISRGDDPVYAFGTRLRQREFTQADFALNALNRPQPIGNFSARFSGSWTGVRLVQDAEGDSQRRSCAQSASSSPRRRTSRSYPRGRGVPVGAVRAARDRRRPA